MTLSGEKTIVSLPYSYNINDKQAFESANMTPGDFQDAICRQFDTLYREGATSGRVMHIAVHPYLTGMPYRIGALDAALKYICKHKKVWKATGSEIARHYRAQFDGLPAEGEEVSEEEIDRRWAHERLAECCSRPSSIEHWTRRMIMRMMRMFGHAALGLVRCRRDSGRARCARWIPSRSARSGHPRQISGRSSSASTRASSPPRTSRPMWSTSSRARRSSSSSRPARSTCRCRPDSSIRSAPSTRARRSRSRVLKCRRRHTPCWRSRASRA